MLIRRARLRGKQGLWDIEITNGAIQSIAQSTERSENGVEVYDAEGRLAVPQFCENHIHLDYANTAGVPRQNQSGTLPEACEIWADRKKAGLNNSDEIRANAEQAARACVKHGVGFIRTHVDVTDPDLIALKTLLQLKRDIIDWCELQIVAFPQNGIIAFPKGKELMEEAMRLGADVVGGIPHMEPTREDGVKSLEFVFDLAEKYQALIDVHCDETDDDQSRFVEVMAAETMKRRMHGRVTVSHAVAMGYYGPGYMARLMPKLKQSGVNFAIAPRENLQLQARGFGAPMPRGVAPVRDLIDEGMCVAFCQDSICDPWYPIGDGNPLRNLDTGLHVSHMLSAQYVDTALDFVTVNPATNLGLKDKYGIEEGKPANLIILGAESDRDAIMHLSMVHLSIHNGKEIFRQSAPDVKWSF